MSVVVDGLLVAAVLLLLGVVVAGMLRYLLQLSQLAPLTAPPWQVLRLASVWALDPRHHLVRLVPGVCRAGAVATRPVRSEHPLTARCQ